MAASIPAASIALVVCIGCSRGDATTSSSGAPKASTVTLTSGPPQLPGQLPSSSPTVSSQATSGVASPITAEAQEPLLPKRTSTAAPAKVTLGTPKIKGTVSEDDVNRAVKRAFGRFLLCYETDLVQTPTLNAKASIQFNLGTEGRPINTRVNSTTPSLNNCLRDAISTVPFPTQPDDSTSVNVPLQFAAGSRTVVEPNLGELTFQGTPLRNTTTTHVERALEKAGCTNVGKNVRKSPSAPTYLTAKLNGARVDVSFRDIFDLVLLPDEAAELRKNALVYQSDGFVLTIAIEGDADRTKAQALLAQIVTVNTRAPTPPKQRRAPEEQER